jgi:hypothetical protein
MPVVDSSLMQQLVDAGRFDDVLREVSLAEVAAAWIRFHHSVRRGDDRGMDDPDWWAVEMWQNDASWADEQRLRNGVLALVDAAENDLDFGAIGAGIVEYVITDDEDRLRWLEAEAEESERFRRSLANIHVWGQHRDEVAARVETAARVRLPRPRGWAGP